METLLLGDQAKMSLGIEVIKNEYDGLRYNGDPYLSVNTAVGMTIILKGTPTKILMSPEQARVIGKCLKKMAKEIKNDEWEIR